MLTVESLSKTIDGEKILDNLTFTLNREDKVAFVGGNELAKTVLFQDPHRRKWNQMREPTNGGSQPHRHIFRNFGGEFDNMTKITEWLTQYSEEGHHLCPWFPRNAALWRRGRCNTSEGSFRRRKGTLSLIQNDDFRRNVLLFDELTNHLDMEVYHCTE